jgi:hypothetical protein
MRQIRSPSPALVVACIALAVALGGTAVAAVTALPPNSVGGVQMKNNAVGASEIKAGAVRSSEVKNFSLLRQDFKRGQISAGPQGPPGPQGHPGLSGREVVSTQTSLDSSNSRQLAVACPSGKKVIGGGYRVTGPADQAVTVTDSYPNGDTQWAAAAIENNSTVGNWRLIAYAICAVVP